MDWAVRMQSILNFPVDVSVFDQVIAAVYDGTASQDVLKCALQVIAQFKAHPDAWTQADQILQNSGRMESKFVALQTLDDCIESRWSRLSQEHRLGIRNFISGMCVHHSRDAESLQRYRILLEKLNYTLVQVLKKEWPQNWPSFIHDIVESSKGSETWMQNNLAILRQLSEEIFDFSKWKMTQQQIKERKDALNKEFVKVFQMVMHVLETKENPSLVCETLHGLERFLGWIPLGYIFRTELIKLLCTRFLPSNMTRNFACRCLTEIAALTGEDCMQYGQKYLELYVSFVESLTRVLPVQEQNVHHYFNDFAGQCTDRSPGGDPEAFVSSLAEFFSTFHRNHLHLLEVVVANQQNPLKPQVDSALHRGHLYLLAASYFHDEEVFKTCVEYWKYYAVSLHSCFDPSRPSALWGPAPPLDPAVGMWIHPRVGMYETISQQVRLVLIKRMTRPEEVIVFEDENGEVVHQQMKDVASIAFYEVMREALVFLTHLNPPHTEATMLELFDDVTNVEKVKAMQNGNPWSPGPLATLCWAVGSISGAMDEGKERDFVVKVLRNLLTLCEAMKGKANKASIASDIMYVVGQYPRFLKAHWRFLRTVIAKLLEFMHETFEGVQEMACETLLKITNQCKEQFVIPHQEDNDPSQLFVAELLKNLQHHTQMLKPNQLLLFHESVGFMIRSAHPSMQEGFVSILLQHPNLVWQDIINQAGQRQAILADVGEMQKLGQCLKMFVRAAHSVGPGIQAQVFLVFESMMKLYGHYSALISQEVAQKGEGVTRHHHVRSMRIVKKEILRLVEEYVKEAIDLPMVSSRVLPPLMDTVLTDFSSSLPTARDAQVLSLMTAIAKRLEFGFSPHLPKVLTATLQPTLAMIKDNFTEFPEHRVLFFKLLQTLNHHCFDAFLAFIQASGADIVNAIIWAFRHTEQSVQDTGLETLLELLQQVQQKPDVAYNFFAVYLNMLLHEVFSVLTDTMHKTGFSFHTQILLQLTTAAKVMGDAGRQLQEQPQGVTAAEFVKTRLSELLSHFDTVSPQQRTLFIEGMFSHIGNLMGFKSHLRDFLVQLKSFAEIAADPLAEERAKQEAEAHRTAQEQQRAMVPGLMPQVAALSVAHQPSTADIGME